MERVHVILKFCLLAIILLTASGCASRVVKVNGDYDSISVELSRKSSGDLYYLKSNDGRVVGRSVLKRGKLDFSLPSGRYAKASNRLYVSDKDGDVVKLKDRTSGEFFNRLWPDYVRLTKKRSAATDRLSKLKEEMAGHRKELLSSKRWLRRNQDVYKASSSMCIIPDYGKMPAAACRPEDRERVSAAMCAAVMGGCEVAQSYSRDSTVTRFLGSQACGLLVAELMDDDYDLNDALGTFVTDVAANMATSMLESDNLFSNLVGAVIGVGVVGKKIDDYSRCAREAGWKCSSLYSEWRKRPEDKYRNCRSHMKSVEYLRVKIPSVENEIGDVTSNIKALESSISTVKRKRDRLFP